ncbi:hypothetical protein HPP92_009934 [Vanilla planifolia]|uniref:Fungal lipase-type domain-containing protein n=1 Tax=Vanilla planifolia TaxID=51239 RepID=A0A835R5F5_VANPL|nr:hypothetical protein HPP92_009934 [Vanilla planifolia]
MTDSLYSRVESWIRDQTARLAVKWPSPTLPGTRMAVKWPSPVPPGWSWRWPQWPRWPPWKERKDRLEQDRLLREEYERQRRQLNDLCRAAKAESVADLQEILCSMVLAECVYKWPATEMVRAINKFKGDFGGQLISLEHVQASLDHVPHRYLLAEAGDTLFASFIGTKQYKDVITDANFFQGAIFHEDSEADFEAIDAMESDAVDSQKKVEENLGKHSKANNKKLKKNTKPAAHRGFMARAKGIPALEIYRLAQKKNRKLVLCGHSLGGAVAALATLAILRGIASSSISKEQDKIQVKCITFSQPPVGNAALKDYVLQKGWQKYFKSYCIPEDLVPRILSPAYFHHYTSQAFQSSFDVSLVKSENHSMKSQTLKSKDTNGEQLVMGLGPVQMPLWRLSKLVPLEGVQKHLSMLRRVGSQDGLAKLTVDYRPPSVNDAPEAEPQSLEIREGSDGISLKPIYKSKTALAEGNRKSFDGRSGVGMGGTRRWRRVPYLPSYVPFGQLFLLRNSSVELLPDAEYSKLTSVRSIIMELRERFQSHSMRSYRSRFQKIFEQFMCINASIFLGMEPLPHFSHLQQLFGVRAGGSVELGHIVDPPVIRTATSILPLGWNGLQCNKNAEPLKVDIIGHGLDLCSLVQAKVNGQWCSTIVESITSVLSDEQDLQKMRVTVGSPLKKPPKFPVDESLPPLFSCPVMDCINTSTDDNFETSNTEGLGCFVVYCTSDFFSISKQVHVRVRRVRLLGFEGSGKTSLLKAVLDQNKKVEATNLVCVQPEKSIMDGLFYLDSVGVNLQELNSEAKQFREELQKGIHDLSKKIDLVVLVHNLSQRIPQCLHSRNSLAKPALSILLDEVKSLGIPWVLTLTNKFSVSAHEQNCLVKSAMEAYEAPPSLTQVINSHPFVVPTTTTSFQSSNSTDISFSGTSIPQKFVLSMTNLFPRPFKRNNIIFPVEGVDSFQQLVHHVLLNHEEKAFQELANERLSLVLVRERKATLGAKALSQEKGSSATTAAVGASLGAGLGLVVAVVMAAASAFRKP